MQPCGRSLRATGNGGLPFLVDEIIICPKEEGQRGIRARRIGASRPIARSKLSLAQQKFAKILQVDVGKRRRT